MAEINYINGYEIADAKAREDASDANESASKALQKANANTAEINNVKSEVSSLASGSPKGVYASVSALETDNPDTGVYIVSANGHIYSWTKDAVSAIDLGIYQATGTITDATLTQSGVAADAKATGDAIKELKLIFPLEKGTLDADGQEQTINTRCRTKFFTLNYDVKITAFSGYQFAIYYYDNNETFINHSNYGTSLLIEKDLMKKYRILLKRTDETAFSDTYTSDYLDIENNVYNNVDELISSQLYSKKDFTNYNLTPGTYSMWDGNIFDGDSSFQNKTRRTQFIDVTPGNKYIFKCDDSSNLTCRIYKYNSSNNSYIGYIGYSKEVEYIAKNTEKIKITFTVGLEDDPIDDEYVYDNTEIIEYSKILSDIDENINEMNESINYLNKAEFNGAKGIFCIMTYNVGSWYNGSGQVVPNEKQEQFVELQSNIINRYQPDILCLQECSTNFSNNISSDQFLTQFYKNKSLHQGNTQYGGKAICSNMNLIDSSNTEYNDNTGRNYEKAYVYLNGRKVLIVSTHLSLYEIEIASEITELLALVANEQYFIICADTNLMANDAQMDRFRNAGYKTANTGQYITYPSTEKSLDNIIMSNNFDINYSLVDTQKEGLSEGEDHYPFITYLIIK